MFLFNKEAQNEYIPATYSTVQTTYRVISHNGEMQHTQVRVPFKYILQTFQEQQH